MESIHQNTQMDKTKDHTIIIINPSHPISIHPLIFDKYIQNNKMNDMQNKTIRQSPCLSSSLSNNSIK